MAKLIANTGRNEIIRQLKLKDPQIQSLLKVTAETLVNSNIEKAWEWWTELQHIKRWNNIFED